MARMVQCVKLGREAEGLDFPPYPGELGKRIYESVSKEAWAQWLRHQTMLVNENRLSLADARARKWLAGQMGKQFFGGGGGGAGGFTPSEAVTSHPPQRGLQGNRCRRGSSQPVQFWRLQSQAPARTPIS